MIIYAFVVCKNRKIYMFSKNKFVILGLPFILWFSDCITAETELPETCTLCEKITEKCRVLGRYPRELSWVINGIKNTKIRKNRMLLYGPPGNGKSLIAETIAHLTESAYHFVDTPSVVHFVGDGSQAIKQEFAAVLKKIDRSPQKRVVVFFDEINNLAAHTSRQGRSEHKAALTELRLKLDEHKNNPQIFIICAANSLIDFDPAFLDRFNYQVKIQDPNLNERQEILQYYATEYQTSLTPEQINDIALKTEDASRRSLKGLIDYLEQQATNDNKGIVTNKMIEKRLIKVKEEIERKRAALEEEKRE